MDKVRIDKYLWSIRIYKSRSIAADAIKSGKVKLRGETSKASSLVSSGDLLEVNKDGFKITLKAVMLIDKRVSATLARPCYEDLTPQAEYAKYQSWFIGKSGPERREKGAGRPTKKDRRELIDFKDETQKWWEDFDDEP